MATRLLTAEPVNSDCVALFQSEQVRGTIVPASDLLSLSAGLRDFTIFGVDLLCTQYCETQQIERSAGRVYMRRGILPVAHLFFDRLLRISRALNQSGSDVAVPKGRVGNAPSIAEDVEAYALDPGFNQWVISYLAPVWNLEASQVELEFEPSPSVPSRNRLFQMDVTTWRERLALRWNMFIGRLFPRETIPVLTLANADVAFHRRGFFLRKDIKRVSDHWTWPDVSMDQDRRIELFTALARSEAADKLFSFCGLSGEQRAIARSLLVRFFCDFFPAQFLEGVGKNHAIADDLLREFQTRALISSGDGSSHSMFVIGAARARGFKIVKFQHGGHYGYYRDFTHMLEVEFPDTDIFLSWGWTRLPEHPEFSSLQVLPMPGPWMSERRLYWSKYRIGLGRRFDMLWMPQMMKRFPGAPQGASSVRRDVLQSFSAEMIDVARHANERKVRIHCKPYNALTLYLMRETYAQLETVGGEYFDRAEHFDKGLTMETLNHASLVLWDQPGTGFLECLQCGIPTMILWSRLYCEEEEWCVGDFKALEDAGIVHRTASTLFDEYARFKLDPHAWMKKNSSVVSRFVAR
ncbi:MAG TPA: transferase [Leptospiraceae bacterium]|nr:transferase [Leptospiraceae bacterium]